MLKKKKMNQATIIYKYMNHEQLNHKTINESYRSLCEKTMNYVKITCKKNNELLPMN